MQTISYSTHQLLLILLILSLLWVQFSEWPQADGGQCWDTQLSNLSPRKWRSLKPETWSDLSLTPVYCSAFTPSPLSLSASRCCSVTGGLFALAGLRERRVSTWPFFYLKSPFPSDASVHSGLTLPCNDVNVWCVWTSEVILRHPSSSWIHRIPFFLSCCFSAVTRSEAFITLVWAATLEQLQAMYSWRLYQEIVSQQWERHVNWKRSSSRRYKH